MVQRPPFSWYHFQLGGSETWGHQSNSAVSIDYVLVPTPLPTNAVIWRSLWSAARQGWCSGKSVYARSTFLHWPNHFLFSPSGIRSQTTISSKRIRIIASCTPTSPFICSGLRCHGNCGTSCRKPLQTGFSQTPHPQACWVSLGLEKSYVVF